MPSCVQSQLKYVYMEYFRGYKEEISMVKYFLENAHVLEKMVIQWDQLLRKGDFVETIENISELPKSCLIVFE